ncbi:MAG TPA: 50S ribosomal protein L1 [Ignavibacteria bacterium]|nr:50S ribosomal protein L1 [Ignavibacteria bacterium]
MQKTKRNKVITEKVDITKEYTIVDAVKILKENSSVNFVESLDCAMRLGVDPRHADQMIRGTVSLPNGTGKDVKVLVIAKDAKAKEALDAGADFAGMDEYLEKIKDGWADVDVIIATPDTMADLGKLGRMLGPKGLMPNPKSGTVTMDVANAVKEVKAGKIEFRVEKAGIVHSSLGKLNFDTDKLTENVEAFIKILMKMRPSSVKGQYVKSVFLSSTMGPGLKISKEELAI